MKANRGCVNPECKAYKKIKYKDDDNFCSKCGRPLYYVCSDCWKALEDDSETLCLACKTRRAQKKAEQKEAIKEGAQAVAGVVVAVGGAVGAAAGGVGGAADKVAKAAKCVKGIKKK